MGLFIRLFLLFFTLSLQAQKSYTHLDPTALNYGLKKDFSQAFSLYLEQEIDSNNSSVLLDLGFMVLDEGIRSDEQEKELLSLFGASLTHDEKAIDIFKEGLNSRYQEIQLQSLFMLFQVDHQRAFELLNQALSSPFFFVQIQALNHLRRYPSKETFSKIESLFYKSNSQEKLFFPDLFASFQDNKSAHLLKQFLRSPDNMIRKEALVAIAHYKRDDLLQEVHKLSLQFNAEEKEIACLIFQIFKDQTAIKILQRWAKTAHVNVRLSALKALYMIGVKETYQTLIEMSEKELFALFLLKDIQEASSFLEKNRKEETEEFDLFLNRTLALLSHGKIIEDERLFNIFQEDSFCCYQLKESMGSTLHHWQKVFISEKNPLYDHQKEMSLRLREKMMASIYAIDTKRFFQLSHFIFLNDIEELYPKLFQLMEKSDSKEVLDKLYRLKNSVGKPFLRHYALLTLYKMKKSPILKKQILQFLKSKKQDEIIQLRASKESDLLLTPKQSSRLFLESLEVLLEEKDQEALQVLLTLLTEGKKENQYVLSGLLVQMLH